MAGSSSHDPKEVFLQALRFNQAWYLLAKAAMPSPHAPGWRSLEGGTSAIDMPDFPPTFIPALVCSVFSVELYLKAILCLESLPIPGTHDLEALFVALPPAWRDELRTAYVAEIPKPGYAAIRESGNYPKDIDSNLQVAAKAFVKWRYMFEGVDLPGYWLDPVRNLLLKTIRLHKPDWEPLVSCLNTPPMRPVPTVQVPDDAIGWSLQVGSQDKGPPPQPVQDCLAYQSEQWSPQLDQPEMGRPPQDETAPEVD